MFCGYCGTKNPTEAKFCINCGKSLNESQTNPEYCTNCGSKINGCGEVRMIDQTYISEINNEEEEETEKPDLAKKVLNTIANSFAIAVAAISLIFVFLIGINVTVDKYSNGFIENLIDSKLNIYYFFGQGYKDVEASLIGTQLSDSFYEYSLYLPIFFGTIASVSGIISVVTLSIITFVRCGKNLAGKGGNKGSIFGIISFLAFVVAVLTINDIINIDIKYNYFDEKQVYGVTLNNATIAGLILDGCFVAAYAGCAIAARGKQLANKNAVINLIMSLVGVVFVIIVLILLGLPLILFKYNSTTPSSNFSLNYFILLKAFGKKREEATSSIEDAFDGEYVMAVFAPIAFLCLILLVILGVLIISTHLKAIIEGEERKTEKEVMLHIFMLVSAVLLLVFTIVFIKQFRKGIEIYNKSKLYVSVSYALPITILIFSALSLVTDIVKNCMTKIKT